MENKKFPVATQQQAIDYTNNETLWQCIWVQAWQDPVLLQLMKDNAKNANAFLQEMSKKFNIPLVIPEGVTVVISFDDSKTKNIIMPAVENIPASPIAMVPYAL